MDRQEFERRIADVPRLAETIRRAAEAAIPPTGRELSDRAVMTLMFPVTRLVLRHIGLPWSTELRYYDDWQHENLRQWIDDAYCDAGFDPDDAEAAAEALCAQLEATTDPCTRAAWEQLWNELQLSQA